MRLTITKTYDNVTKEDAQAIFENEKEQYIINKREVFKKEGVLQMTSVEIGAGHRHIQVQRKWELSE